MQWRQHENPYDIAHRERAPSISTTHYIQCKIIDLTSIVQINVEESSWCLNPHSVTEVIVWWLCFHWLVRGWRGPNAYVKEICLSNLNSDLVPIEALLYIYDNNIALTLISILISIMAYMRWEIKGIQPNFPQTNDIFIGITINVYTLCIGCKHYIYLKPINLHRLRVYPQIMYTVYFLRLLGLVISTNLVNFVWWSIHAYPVILLYWPRTLIQLHDCHITLKNRCNTSANSKQNAGCTHVGMQN